MKLQSVNGQANDVEPAVASRGGERSVRFRATPAVFDTSAASPVAFRCRVGAVERSNWPLRGGGLPGGGPVPQPERMAKARALLLDGWSAAAAAAKAGIGEGPACDIRRAIEMPAVPPLRSREFRTNVVAWLQLGMSEAQIAHDMGVQPETVHAIAEAQHEVGQGVGAPRASRDHALLDAIVKRVGRAHLLPATRKKMAALLQDGWPRAAVVEGLGICRQTVAHVKRSVDLAVAPPLSLETFRDEVVARLRAGVSVLEVARERGVQPETVSLIGLEYVDENPENPISDVRLHQEAKRPGTASTWARSVSRSPRPGTSSGGETHPVHGRSEPSSPVAKRRRVDEAPGVISDALVSAIIEQGTAGLSTHQIADNVGLSEDTVWHTEFLYLQRSLVAEDEPTRVEHARPPPSPAATSPASPDIVQAVIHSIDDPLLDDEFAAIDMDAFKAMTRSPGGGSPG